MNRLVPEGAFNTHKYKLEQLKEVEDEYEVAAIRQQWSVFFASQEELLEKLDELKLVCRTGDMIRIRKLVEEEGVPVNVRDRWDAVPLYYACLCGQESTVEYLLSKGARCEENTFDGERCLYAAHSPSIKKMLREFKLVVKTDPYHEFLRRLVNNKKLHSDITFVVHGEEINAHKIVLCARSRYFTEQFNTRWKGRSKIRLIHQLLHPHAFSAILRFLYTGRIEIPVSMLNETMLMCKQCKLPELAEILKRDSELRPNAAWLVYDESVKNIHAPSPCQMDINSLARKIGQVAIKDENNGKEEIETHLDQLSQDSIPFADMIMIVQGKKFHLHKLFVAARSEYFNAIIQGNFKDAFTDEDGKSVGKLNSISPEVFAVLVEYLYSDKVHDIHPDILIGVLQASDLFMLPGLKAICIGFIQQHVAVENVFDIIEISRTFSATKLEDHCIYFIALHLTKIVKHHFMKLVALIQESATSIKQRQETDSIPIVDEIRSYLDKIYGDLDEDSTLEQAQSKYSRLKALDSVLKSIGIDI